jgi:hypothetical protein
VQRSLDNLLQHIDHRQLLVYHMSQHQQGERSLAAAFVPAASPSAAASPSGTSRQRHPGIPVGESGELVQVQVDDGEVVVKAAAERLQRARGRAVCPEDRRRERAELLESLRVGVSV